MRFWFYTYRYILNKLSDKRDNIYSNVAGYAIVYVEYMKSSLDDKYMYYYIFRCVEIKKFRVFDPYRYYVLVRWTRI